jgi:hypothetical protein
LLFFRLKSSNLYVWPFLLKFLGLSHLHPALIRLCLFGFLFHSLLPSTPQTRVSAIFIVFGVFYFDTYSFLLFNYFVIIVDDRFFNVCVNYFDRIKFCPSKILNRFVSLAIALFKIKIHRELGNLGSMCPIIGYEFHTAICRRFEERRVCRHLLLCVNRRVDV